MNFGNDKNAFRLIKSPVILDFANCKYIGEIHKILKENFGLPDYYGENRDALWDCLRYLFYDEEDFADIVKLLGLEGCRVAEIAECMTLPLSRGNNFMFKINSVLVQRAKEKGIEYLIATAHPDNNASNHSLQKLGMKIKGQFYRYGKYYRNYLVMKI